VVTGESPRASNARGVTADDGLGVSATSMTDEGVVCVVARARGTNARGVTRETRAFGATGSAVSDVGTRARWRSS
jgi:hypothetical protein